MRDIVSEIENDLENIGLYEYLCKVLLAINRMLTTAEDDGETMATVKDVLEKYHKLVPFPITLAKVKKAGYKPEQYLRDLAADLNQCSDKKDGKSKKLIAALNQALPKTPQDDFEGSLVPLLSVVFNRKTNISLNRKEGRNGKR